MPHYVLESIPVNMKDFLNVKQIEAEMRKATANIRKEIVADFRKTVQTWDHPVNFRSRTDVSGGQLVMYVYTSDKIFMYVNDGTRPHSIEAKNKPRLAVRTGFHPKTQVGQIGSSKGGYSGSTYYAMKVEHPGVVARRFNDVIADKYRAELFTALVDAMWRGVR
jgi:hypothetical protein